MIACGGDGTVHGVLQAVAQTAAVLGVLPFGTANALARNLKLPLEPVAALRCLLGYKPQRIPLGLAQTEFGERWFTVLAGAGPDGMLVEAEVNRAGSQSPAKVRFGRFAYYGRAARLFLTRHFPPFLVEYREPRKQTWERCEAVGVLASRVPDLGGLFRGLTAQSRLHHPYLEVQILRGPAFTSLPAWFALSQLRRPGWNRQLKTVRVEELRCTFLGDANSTPRTQVDGEGTGKLPFGIRLITEALWLLAPE